jgi:hypothetical protein
MPSLRERFKKALPTWLLLLRRYRKTHGVFPNVLRPGTLNEKILYRMLFDRRPILRRLADKVAVRPYVQDRLGPGPLPKLYWLGRRPGEIPFEALPDRFVVKPTHGSGWVRIVRDKAALDRRALVAECERWLKQSYYEITREWVYKGIAPKILVEELIEDGNSGPVPNDYRLFVFGGGAGVQLIEVNVGHLASGRVRLYTRQWEKLAPEPGNGDVPRPAHLDGMVTAASDLCGDLDFIRVDFYDTPAQFYFAEITLSPECGMGRFILKGLDRRLGECWQLPRWDELRPGLTEDKRLTSGMEDLTK